MSSDEIVEIHEWPYPPHNRQDSNSSATSEYDTSPYGRDSRLIYEEFHSLKAKRLKSLAFRQRTKIIDLEDWQEGLEGPIACLEHEQEELYEQISDLTVSNVRVILFRDQFKQLADARGRKIGVLYAGVIVIVWIVVGLVTYAVMK